MAELPARRPAEQYRRLWRTTTRPSLQEFVATLPSLTIDQLVDVIEVDQAERWQRGERVLAEEYLHTFPSIQHQPELAIVVIYGEYFIRTERNEHPSLAEYMSRFPTFARRLREQVQWHEAIDLIPQPTMPTTLPEFPGYQTVAFAGRGATCCVYEAKDILDQPVAIKVLDPMHRRDHSKLERFRREAEAGGRLRHPNIVPTYSVEDTDDGPFIVMEFCSGGSLAVDLRNQPWPMADVPKLLSTVAQAVHFAHGDGIIHRDIKPGNILLDANRVPKVSDFGLAKVLGSGSITATGEILGTPCYMAPEQTDGIHEVPTDVYALGTVLYECLTGRPPFVHASPMEVLRMIREDTPLPPSEFNPEISPELQAICLRCLEKVPTKRFATAAEFAEALDGLKV
jgi:serine/threonine protein kinase